MSPQQVDPIPLNPNVHDEFHPSPTHGTVGDIDTAADESRRLEKETAVSKDTVMHESAVPSGGMPFPTAAGVFHTTPAILSDKPTASDAQPILSGEQIRGTALEAMEKPLRSHSHSTASSTSDNNASSLGTKVQTTRSGGAVVEKPTKKGGLFSFGKKKKEKDEADKKNKDKEDEANAIPPIGFFALFRFATPFEIVLDLIGLLLSAASGAAQPLMTLIFGRLTTSFTNFGTLQLDIASGRGSPAENARLLEEAKAVLKTDSGKNALYLMAIGLGIFVCTWAYMFIWNYTGEIMSKRVRERYLRAVLRQEIAYFDDLGAGEVATRIQTDCHLVQEGTSEKISLIVMYIATFITGFALAFARNWRLALALSSIMPVIMIAGGIMMSTMSRFNQASLDATAKAGTLAEEVVGSIRTVHAFGTAQTLKVKFDIFMRTMKTAGKKTSIGEGIGLAVMFFAIYAAYALAFFYGGILVTQGRADSGMVINVFMSVLIGSFSLAMLAPELSAVTKARAAAAKLYSTIERVPLIDSADPSGEQPSVVEGRITFENVKFHYPSRPNVPILKDLTTSFAAGNTVALVGASGSGKSTVVSLVERFYDPIEGIVKLDGRDIKTLNIKWLRRQIGLVSQEPTLFGTTVRGNVEHGLIGSKWENASDEEKFELVKKACIDANAHDFILKLPNGYDTHVGERGMLLSGGQKQRVAIARAIVSDPRILLLDEATSALDTQSEGIVQDALDKASKGRTTITIAHRLSTIKDADLILVMGGGEILEQGTHNDLLLNEDGPYAQLVSNQKLAAEAKEIVLEAKEDEIYRPKGPVTPGSPVNEKGGYGFPGLARATTAGGRSLASAAMEDVTARREEEAAEDDKMPSAFGMYKRLFYINRDQKTLYIIGTIGAICSGMVYPALAILFGKAISDFQLQPAELRAALTDKAKWYFITAILAAIAIVVQIMGFSRTGWDLTAKLRSQQFSAVLRHDIEWFDDEKNSTGAVTSNLADHPQRVQGLFGTTMGTIIQSVATLVGGCIIGLAYGPLLALIGIACVPLTICSGFIRLKVVVNKDQKMKKIHSKSAHLASEAAGAVRTVASLTREDDVDRIYSKSLEEPLNMSVRGAVKSQALYGASQGIAFLVIALVFYIGALWIIDERYDTATFFTVLTAVIFAAIQAGNVFTFVPDASKANGAAAAIFRLLDNRPEVDALSTEGIHLNPEKVEGHVKIDNVHFRYPSRPGVRVLRDLSIDVPPGTYVALVGPSGCGKSTTVQMLERFYDPLVGKVTLDGVDIKDLNVASYRNQLALVSQEPTLYAGTVRFNILLGANKPAEEITEDEIIMACKNANIYDFIMSLPDGFDTEVGGKGSQLSGGQKQRIAIARALIRNPKVLLLDEATSALDSQSEKVVQEALDKAARGRTTIAIAHRLSTIQKADIIYCFAEGKVAEKGTHQELLAKKGAYYELVQMQNLSRQ